MACGMGAPVTCQSLVPQRRTLEERIVRPRDRSITRVQALQSEREARSVVACLQELTECNDAETATTALLCIKQLLQAVLDKPSCQRVRRLRRSNVSLQRRLLCANAGEALLVAVGFEPWIGTVGTPCDEQQGSSHDKEPGFVLPQDLALPFLQMTLETITTHAAAISTRTSTADDTWCW